MRLAHPTPIRLSTQQLQALDRWRGDRMSRATAIRFLLDQALNLHLNAILPATGGSLRYSGTTQAQGPYGDQTD